MATPQGRAAAQFVYNRLLSHGISPVYATAVLGHLIEESGFFSPDVISGQRRGDQGTAGFVAQWRGDRLNNLHRFAQEQGRPLDLATQIDFLVHEGRSGLDRGAQRWYQQAITGRGNMRDAVAAFAHFERPAGYTANNPYGIDTFDKRMANASNVSQMVGGEGAALPPYLQNAPTQQGAAPGQPSTSQLGNVGDYTAPSLTIDYGDYGISTPDLTRASIPKPNTSNMNTLWNGAPYTSAFGNDPFLEGTF